MTSGGDTALPAPGAVGRIGAGAVGGLAGGVVFGVLMQATGRLSMVAGLVGRESILVGWGVHMASRCSSVPRTASCSGRRR